MRSWWTGVKIVFICVFCIMSIVSRNFFSHKYKKLSKINQKHWLFQCYCDLSYDFLPICLFRSRRSYEEGVKLIVGIDISTQQHWASLFLQSFTCLSAACPVSWSRGSCLWASGPANTIFILHFMTFNTSKDRKKTLFRAYFRFLCSFSFNLSTEYFLYKLSSMFWPINVRKTVKNAHLHLTKPQIYLVYYQGKLTQSSYVFAFWESGINPFWIFFLQML